MTFYGVRGSTPCHGHDIVGYGGNTSCVAVDIPGADPIVFDMGTGLRYFGKAHDRDTPFRGTFLLSHLHWDHIQGLPFFVPILQPDAEIELFAPVQDDGRTVAEVFADTIRPPLFPVALDVLPGSMTFREVEDTTFELAHPSGESADAVTVMSRLIPHVGPTVGYRVTWRDHSVVYMSDHQMPHDGSFSATDGALELCRDADLVIHDAQFTPDEFAQRRDWGHCTLDYAVWLAAGSRHPVVVDTVALLASILTGAAFVVAGGSKLAAGDDWPRQARGLGAPDWSIPLVPWFELALGAVLITQLARRPAALAAVVTLAVFSALIARRLSEGAHPPCACFGRWSSQPLSWRHLARNAVLLALATLSLL